MLQEVKTRYTENKRMPLPEASYQVIDSLNMALYWRCYLSVSPGMSSSRTWEPSLWNCNHPRKKESACNVGDLGSIPGLGISLEKGKATHSSVLAWRIPWTVQSVGLQRVGHNWATFTSLHFTSRKIGALSPSLCGRVRVYITSIGVN